MEVRSTHHNLIISGIPEHEDEDLKEVVEGFFKITMEISSEIAVKAVYRVGKGTARKVCVVLSDLSDKAVVYKHAKNLKEKTNSIGKAFYVNDDLPPEVQEEQRKY